MIKYTTHLTFFFLTVVLGISCRKDHFKIDPPAYISIPAFVENGDCFSTGAVRKEIQTLNVTDAWVFVDGKLQGNYELPVQFPVIAEGAHHIEIRPGIKKNGISATRAIYPFYEFYETDVVLTQDKVVRIDPCIAYRPSGLRSGEVKVAWNEDFEAVVDLQYNPFSDTVVTAVSKADLVLNGNFSGGIFLGQADDFFELLSPDLSGLPTNGNPIYLELDYKSNHDFSVGLYSHNREIQQNLLSLRARATWTKVYIDLSSAIQYNGNSPNFNVFIGFPKNKNIPSVEMYIDNIALLYL
jgi:hypothetical protein